MLQMCVLQRAAACCSILQRVSASCSVYLQKSVAGKHNREIRTPSPPLRGFDDEKVAVERMKSGFNRRLMKILQKSAICDFL